MIIAIIKSVRKIAPKMKRNCADTPKIPDFRKAISGLSILISKLIRTTTRAIIIPSIPKMEPLLKSKKSIMRLKVKIIRNIPDIIWTVSGATNPNSPEINANAALGQSTEPFGNPMI